MDRNKKIIAVIMCFGMVPTLWAAGKTIQNPVWSWVVSNIIFLIAFVVILIALFALWETFESIIYHERRKALAERGIELKSEIPEAGDSIVKKLYDKAWSLVPMEREGEIDLGHEYDGIRELDNRLPPWWVYTFYFTIIFGIGYAYVYEFSDIGLSQQQEYAEAMEESKVQKMKFLFAQSNAVNETNVVALTDVKSLQEAHDIYAIKCASCHGKQGQGLKGLGPNFADQYWKHGGGVKNIFSTIKYGVPEKGMIAWKTQMQASDIHKLASFILTFEGTNPPDPKDPEGEIWFPDETSETESSN